MVNVVQTVLLVGIFLAATGTLGVAIAILVNVLNNNNNNPKPSPPGPSPNVVLNVPQPPEISSSDDRFAQFQQVAQLFHSMVNTSVDPCDDFYAYTCGNFNGDMSFDVSDNSNIADMVDQLLNDKYIASAPLPVQQTRWYFDKCIEARSNWNKLVADGSFVMNKINALSAGEPGFESRTAVPFPMLNQTANVDAFPDGFGLPYLVGTLAGEEGIYTFVSPYVDTNWKDPAGPDGYAYFIDQPTTFLPNTYYLKSWDSSKVALTTSILSTMNILAQTQGITLNQTLLKMDVDDIVQLDYLLATVFSTDDTTRRQYERSYNPNTIGQLQQNFDKTIFNWHMFIPLATGKSDEALARVLNDPNYNYFIVMEPVKLKLLLDNMNPSNKLGITPRAVVNYLFYRLVDAYSDFLPNPDQDDVIRPITVLSKGHRGKPKHIVPDERRFSRRQVDDVSIAQYECAAETISQMQYANARVFVDNIYPTPESRAAVRDHVARIASSIVVGFRSMIDQLDWMTASTKSGAYNKIDNLVKNIAYPEWITDDIALSKYHATMNFTKNTDYLSMLTNTNDFNLYSQWIQLVQDAADRTGFNGPPGVTNAWYQPEVNSITFPAGILKQPFYDFKWPAAVNFGAMGVIAGHELTHGFDDEGVQWDGTGILSGWMDDQSKADFVKMAQCVVDEYSGFCPLNKTAYGKAACVDGAQTQGENIADNGGIHSAFRAYKNYVDLYGADPVLPDDKFQYFTADQLFFLSFAQVWCQLPPSDARMLRQLLVDVHSPSVYRVWGTIQNFPAFKNAFNCPVSKYAPEKHCNVWVSDTKPTYGLPLTKTDLNIVPEAPITARDIPKFNAYQSAVDYYSKSVNLAVDPCDDFYAYACGSFNQPVSFSTARARNLVYMAQQLRDPNYQAVIKNSTALTKEKRLFDECVKATQSQDTENQILINKNYTGKKMETLKGYLKQDFTLLTGGIADRPNRQQLADALGHLSFVEAVDTYVSPLVDTYWVENSRGYEMFLDQNSGYLAKTYYQPKAWAIERPKYLSSTLAVLKRYAHEQGVELPDDTEKRLGDVLDFEQMIAINYSTDDDKRRQFKRSWNLKNVSDLNNLYPFIDWPTYLQHVPETARALVTNGNYQISVMENEMLRKFSTAYSTLDADKLVNLLYIRLLLANTQFIPSYATAFAGMPDESVTLGLSRRRRRLVNAFKFPPSVGDNVDNGPSCAGVANELMQFSNGRVFVDYMYPTEADVQNIRNSAGGIINNIVSSFQGMIEQLDWMDADTKKKALAKTDTLQKNIAFPDWIKNDTALDAYYGPLDISDTDNYYDIYDKLIKFNIYLQYNQLTFASTDRSDFLGQPGTVNAWYQPELNSITFPAGILVPPYFHPQWPPSINYGGMGLVAGHELTHGFDDQGVQWDGVGNLNEWMSPDSKNGFLNMTSCVVDEYNHFCPLDSAKYSPNCVKGSQTQGENIADNGGIHAAYRGYRTHQSLDGPDARLPDRLFGQFTHDQLFFLNFAQVWCEIRRSDDDLYKQIMVDPHSPSMYRVFGTIQNFPAFQTAFNCPTGSKSAPADHCRVWVPSRYQ
ncbi:unnamed protein product [Caenorhabditis bovis]|uniref:Peptidase M13 C-terminal domain-containing protein n=1 Tax=Caenorhabditis bovis TaxID=2654633 RepID=A0A8S1FAW8_9PELO|nr:unnamed protein product [Caenorhabditis bovis]